MGPYSEKAWWSSLSWQSGGKFPTHIDFVGCCGGLLPPPAYPPRIFICPIPPPPMLPPHGAVDRKQLKRAMRKRNHVKKEDIESMCAKVDLNAE